MTSQNPYPGGSQQLRIFRRAIRDGATLEQACDATGGIIPAAEGRLYLAADAKNPPPPEAFDLLGPSTKDEAMAKAAEMEDGEGAGTGGEYRKPDAAKAFSIYDEQIAPKLTRIDTARGECSQPWQDIKEHAHFPRPAMNFINSLRNIEDDAKLDHFLLALSGGLEHCKLFLPRDLVTMARGQDGTNVVTLGERRKPQLATLPMGVPSDGTETDLADAGEEPFEAPAEELAGQRARPSSEQAQAEADAAAESPAPPKRRRKAATAEARGGFGIN